MTASYLIALSNAQTGRESDYVDWYVNRHLGDICAIDGVESGSFHTAVTPQAPWNYLGLYRIAQGQAAQVQEAINTRRGTSQMALTDAIDSTTTAFFYGDTLRHAGTDPAAATHRLIAISAPVAGQQEQLDTWYETRHLGDVLALEGYESATLGKILDLGKRGLDPRHSRVCVYDADATTGEELLGRMRSVAGTDAMPISPALDRSLGRTLLYRVLASHP